MTNEHDIAIVGMACHFPKAPTLAQYWYNLANGVDGTRELPPRRFREHANFTLPPEHDACIPLRRGGFLDDEVLFNPVPYGIPPNLVKHGDPDQFFMLALVDEALRDAKIAADDPVRKRTDVIIGRGGYATGKLVELTVRAEMFDTVLELIDRRFPDVLRGRRSQIEDYLRSTLTPRAVDNVSTAVSNIVASRTANRLNLRGAAYAVDAACASSLLAIEQAVWRLRSGQCDLAVGAGLFLSMTPTFLYVFTRLGALSVSQVSRPLDRRADGLLVGEGGGAVILKRLNDACRDGDRIYAIIRGVGSSSDGQEVDVLAPSSKGQVLCLEKAYQDARVDPDTISLLELHGTATIVGDAVEIETVKTFFGRSDQPPTARAMGSVKSMIGHTMPAAGMAALIKTTLALANKIIPPSLNCEQPREELADAPFYVVTQTRPWVHNPALGPRRAGVNAFGFGGINAHVVLEEVAPETRRGSTVAIPRPIDPGVRRASELVVLSAASKEELIERVNRLRRYLALDWTKATLPDVAFTAIHEVEPSHPHKLAIISTDLAQLDKFLATAAERLAAAVQFDDLEEVYYGDHADRHQGRIAFVLPGMGFPGLIGNYPDHLLELCMHFPEVREEFDFFEDRDRHPEDTVPTSSIFSPPACLPEEFRAKLKKRLAPPKVDEYTAKDPPPGERYLAAMGVTLANWVGWVLLRRFHIPVDMITGQSQGEMAALCVAGVCDFHETAPHFWKVLNVDTRDLSGQRLAFAWTSAEKVQPLLDQAPGTYMSIYMAPEGIIFGGDREGLLKVGEELRKEQVLVTLLPYPPIHTPALSHLRDELLKHLDVDEFRLEKPKLDLYSSITAEKYPDDPVGIRETLMLNVDQPLRIWQTIRRMYEDGARIFVQVGGGHMASHLERLLPTGAHAITAALDVDTRDPLTQLNHLCATLFTAGVPLTLAPLYDCRRVTRLDFDVVEPPARPRTLEVPLRIDWCPLYSENVPPRRSAVATEGLPMAEALLPPETDSPPNASAEDADSVEAPMAVSEAQPFPREPSLPTAPATSTEELANWQRAFVELGMPVFGEVTHFVPERELTIRRSLSLSEDLFLHDHLFVFAPTKPSRDCLPVQPLTMSMEYTAEGAAILSPGKGLIGFENVRGLRWVGLREQEADEIRLEYRVLGDDDTGVRRVNCTIYFEGKASFTATALMAESYRQDLQLQIADSSQDGPWPFTRDQVYGERYMFHGPAFHCLAELHTFGNPGASAVLRAMPRDRLFASFPKPNILTDPCMFDGVGQVVGLWAYANNLFILPTSIEKVEFYGPTPPVGTLLPIRMEVVEINLDTKQMRFNVEIEDGQGYLWARVFNWVEFLWKWSVKYADCTRLPSRYLVCDELQAPGLSPMSTLVALQRQDLKDIDPDWAARIFLHSDEMTEYWPLSGHRQRRLRVMSRAAVKDAVRLWWARRYGTEFPHPADLRIIHDEQGAPWLAPVEEPSWPRISVAHTNELAIAAASDYPVGVDVAPVTQNVEEIMPYIATNGEQSLVQTLEAAQPGGAWSVKLWCAKEAVAKLLGTGLQGRPKQFVVIDADPQGCVLIQNMATQERFVVFTQSFRDHVIAYTTLPTAISPDSPCTQRWQLDPALGPRWD
jgi:acyl transferase domain-containing protein/phosphopantetheinyl transferase